MCYLFIIGVGAIRFINIIVPFSINNALHCQCHNQYQLVIVVNNVITTTPTTTTTTTSTVILLKAPRPPPPSLSSTTDQQTEMRHKQSKAKQSKATEG